METGRLMKFVAAGTIGALVTVSCAQIPTQSQERAVAKDQRVGSQAAGIYGIALIARFADGGDRFFIGLPPAQGTLEPSLAVAHGVTHMRNFGCQITELELARTGAIAKVSNPKECLPELR